MKPIKIKINYFRDIEIFYLYIIRKLIKKVGKIIVYEIIEVKGKIKIFEKNRIRKYVAEHKK